MKYQAIDVSDYLCRRYWTWKNTKCKAVAELVDSISERPIIRGHVSSNFLMTPVMVCSIYSARSATKLLAAFKVFTGICFQP
jgi:hypothetical protein